MGMIDKVKFSKVEKTDLLKAWAVLSLAFAILITKDILSFDIIKSLVISGLTVGVGFIFHELGHKFVAQKYGYFAEFRADNSMLVIALMSSFFGFIFAAPGAVMVGGNVRRDKYGLISLAGPVMSIVVALVFLGLSFATSNSFVSLLAAYGFRINAFLAMFNMIPFGGLDGRKIFDWNKTVWVVVVVLAVVLVWSSF